MSGDEASRHQLPYKIYFIGDYWDLDEIEERIFNMFSYPHGKCNMEDKYWYSGEADLRNKYKKYPPCTDFDQEAKKNFIESMDRMYKEHPEWTRSEQDRKDEDDEVFQFEHSHIGIWQITGFKKTGYDYGVQAFAFKNEEELALFLLTHGEDLNKYLYTGENKWNL